MKKDRLAWFKEAKFGLFIHWGPYSVLAGEWNGRQVPVGENAEWIMQKLQIPVDEYRKIAPQFNPVEFDAREWVDLAKAAGMRYLVITAKHHDGFAMYHSQISEYNISNGVVVSQVASGAAARSGIRKGDIILSVDNEPVQDVKQFNALVEALKPGKTVAVLVQRGGSPTFLALRVPGEG